MKKNYARYNGDEGIIEIIVRDESGSKQDVMKANHKDHKTQSRIASMLLEKWNIRLIPEGYVKSGEDGFFEF